MKLWIPLLLCSLLALAACDSLKKLFEEKPSVSAEPAKNGPIVVDDGKAKQPPTDGGDKVEIDRPVHHEFAYPRGATPGVWARWRLRYEEWDKQFVQELVLLGRQGENLWIEETTDIQGFDEVVWRLVTPQGKVLMAYRGKPGEPGKRYQVVERTDVDPDLLQGARDTGKQEEISVPAGSFTAKVHALAEGAGRAWFSDKIPFNGLVKYTSEGVNQVLLAHGTGRKQGKLKRALPVWKGK